ncbi:helix-turn-helix transcriptional regulator [Garciella nitratireducens]|uniref:helix-turn-helix transcriptional regulator n=1 Tax=Garciella nitratireducens TaxID=218205 RepID=UPI0024B61D7E|nr:WYL domain-containing transcriptional regulator [Garciella nitratireducens]
MDNFKKYGKMSIDHLFKIGEEMMSGRSNGKLKLLYIMKILLEKTDEDHPITVYEIIRNLQFYGISAERKSIYSDIDLLKEFGLDIICIKGKANQYFIGSREFQLPELKLLVDAVQSSRFITYKKSAELIKKIEKLCSIYQAKTLHRQVIISDRIKNMNENIYYNIDVIHQGIQENKKIKFQYFDYTMEKKIAFRREGEYYTVSPYALSWSDNNYYLIAYYQRYNGISNFRVDRMKNVQVIKEARESREEFKDFDIVDYSNKIFYMYSGKTEMVELEFDASLINVVLDRFGKDVFIYHKRKNCFCIRTEIIIGDTFLGWLFMFGDKVRVLSPESLKKKIKQRTKKVLKLYE